MMSVDVSTCNFSIRSENISGVLRILIIAASLMICINNRQSHSSINETVLTMLIWIMSGYCTWFISKNSTSWCNTLKASKA
ncbi:hypothetical protein C2G38_2087327, partial [Gigaspora rosea]